MHPGSTSPRPRILRLVCAALIAVAGACFAIVARGTGGAVTGSDAYWYAGDLRMSEATGRAVSNHVYPLFAAAHPGQLPPRMHDAPVTHVASAVFGLAGGSPAVAWLAVNVALTLATALLVAVIARRVGGFGAWGAIGFLVFPSTMWAATAPLAEAGLALGVAVVAAAVVAAARGGRAWLWPVAGVAAALLTWTRSNFVLVLVAVLAWTVWSWRRRRIGAATASIAVAAPVAILAAHHLLSPGYPNAGFAATLMVGAAGASSNMDFYSVPVAFDAGEFAAKAARGVVRAVTPRTLGEAAMPAVVVAGIAMGFAAPRPSDAAERRGLRTLRVVALGLLAVYVVTCAVFQPQTRYIYAVAPVAAAMLDVGVTRLVAGRPRAVRAVAAAAVVAVFAWGAAQSVRTAEAVSIGGRNSEAATQRLSTALTPQLTAPDDAVLVIARGDAADLAAAYAAIRHPTISVDPELIGAGEARRLARDWHVTAIVGAPDDPFVDELAPGAGDPTLVRGSTRRSAVAVWPMPTG